MAKDSSRRRSPLAWFWSVVRGCRVQALLNVALGLLLVCADFSFIFVSKSMIDAAVRGGRPLLPLTLALTGLVVLQIALRLCQRWLTPVLGIRAQNRLQARLFDIVLHGSWRGRESRHTGDVVNRLINDIGTVVRVAIENLPDLVVLIVRLIGAFGFLFLLDARLAVTVVVVLPVMLLLSRVYFRRMRAITHDVRRTDSRVQSLLQEMVQHQLVVKTLCREDEAVRRLSLIHETLRRHILRRTRFSTFSSGVVGVGFSGVYLLAFVWGSYNLSLGVISYGTLMAFVQLVAQIQLPFRQLTRFVPSIINAATAVDRLMEIDYPEETRERAALTPAGVGEPLGLRFRGVSYAYSPQQRTVLHDLTFDFAPGGMHAIVGPTGSGKTTIVRLALALIRATRGVVTLYDGHGEYEPSAGLRERVAYVPQGNTLLSGTIRDNLLFARPEASDAELREALHTACADFALALRDGIDTHVGELGLGLSGGQAQRICIARSLLHGGDLIILDEPTSALDGDTEGRLLANLSRVASCGRTVILVTHRRQAFAHCQSVYSVEKRAFV